MYEKSDKHRLYWLIESYLNKKIEDTIFCDEFYYSYDSEINVETLTITEKQVFSELDKVVSRFSEFGEDHLLDPNAFSTKEELRQAVEEAKKKLNDEHFIL